ncbi:sialic acid-binding Ig-like lectin 5 isoform X6 [Prionailurus viverrinus]|uniref:sialic acid-binding Ig-like lectin 5 isoform X6 n=1 Tax=Prionailurus viverrinus TaxID=61388 RepID=UPI001FF184BE|nr:sialic acid-binding Ig-like lectin 5 isoform X6 [Prionailurus viverrinus]
MPLWLLLLWGGPLLWVLGYQLELQESVTVQEGLCVHVRCKFFLPWFSFGFISISWFQKGADVYYDPPVATNKPDRKLHERTQGRFFLLGDPQTEDCSLYITDVNMGDSGTYFLHVDTHSYLYNMLSLNVTALTHTPHILTPGTLESGRPGDLNCSVPWACERGMPPIFSWTSAAFTSLGPRTRLSSVLTLTPRPQDHGTNLTCQVQFPAIGVMVERTIQLNVTYAPQNTAIRIFQGNRIALETLQNTSSLLIREGQDLRLLCAAAGNPPAELSWFWGSPALNATPMCTTHILELPQVGAAEEGTLTCRAQNSLGSQHVSLRLSVVCPPRLLGPSCSWEGEALGCTCSARARPAPTLSWRLGEGLLEGNHSDASLTVTSSSEGPWANSSLSLRGPLGSGLRLSCEARNAHGEQSAAVLLLPDKKGLLSKALGGGIFLGMGITTLLFLCLILVTKTLRKKQAQAGTLAHAGTPAHAGAPPQAGAPPKPKATRRSTILDYINVVPNPGPLARNRNRNQNRKAMPSSPSQASPPGALSQECKKNQKELHAAPHTCPGPRSSTQASESESNQENLHYAALTFSGLRPWDTRESKDTGPEYEDIKFH